MKTLALLPPLLFLLACSSATSMEDNRVLGCESGQDIEIMAGLDAPRTSTRIERQEDVSVLVEVANNSHQDVVIDTIRVDPETRSGVTSRIDPIFKTVKQDLASGKDHLFRFPVRQTYLTEFDATSPGGAQPQPLRRPAGIVVTVTLTNGDSYRCPFSLAN